VAVAAGAALLLLAAPELFAQEEIPEVIKEMTVADVLKGGGWVGWIIVGLAVIALALAIEQLVTIRRVRLVPPDLVQEVHKLFEKESYQEALELCESEPTFFTNVVASGLRRLNFGFPTMKEAMTETGEEESVKLQQRIGYLNLIGTVAPLLGLFGTVTGMILAFHVIAQKKGSAEPGELAYGIAMALITTFFGLIVAIPINTFFVFMRNKVIRIILDVGAVTGDLFDRFRAHE
jgi:biopolymer transport protein ExbB